MESSCASSEARAGMRVGAFSADFWSSSSSLAWSQVGMRVSKAYLPSSFFWRWCQIGSRCVGTGTDAVGCGANHVMSAETWLRRSRGEKIKIAAKEI